MARRRGRSLLDGRPSADLSADDERIRIAALGVFARPHGRLESVLVGAGSRRSPLATCRHDVHLAERICPPASSVVRHAGETPSVTFAAPFGVALLQPPARVDQQFFHVVLKDVERGLFLKRNSRRAAVDDDDEREARFGFVFLEHQLLVAAPERPTPLLHTAVIGRNTSGLRPCAGCDLVDLCAELRDSDRRRRCVRERQQRRPGHFAVSRCSTGRSVSRLRRGWDRRRVELI